MDTKLTRTPLAKLGGHRTMLLAFLVAGLLGCGKGSDDGPRHSAGEPRGPENQAGDSTAALPAGPPMGASDTTASGAHAPNAPKRFPRLGLIPSDLTTSFGNSPIDILVDNYGQPAGRALLEAIKGRVTLQTWPDGT
jgi:hypothetical protein